MVNELIKKLGISQRTLAAFIESDHTILSRYAAGDVYLQPHVIPELVKMYTLSVAFTAPVQSIPSIPDKIDLQKAANWCRTKCKPLEKKLAATLLLYEQGSNMLQLLAALGPAPMGAAPKKQRWMDEQHYQATLKMEKNGWLIQNKFKMAIQILQQEAEMIENAIQ